MRETRGAPDDERILKMSVPTITDEERREALNKAAEARQRQAEVRQEVREGKLGLEDLLDDPRAQRMRVLSALKTLPGIGECRARRIMAELRIGENRRIKGLGSNQRTALVEWRRKTFPEVQ